MKQLVSLEGYDFIGCAVNCYWLNAVTGTLLSRIIWGGGGSVAQR